MFIYFTQHKKLTYGRSVSIAMLLVVFVAGCTSITPPKTELLKSNIKQDHSFEHSVNTVWQAVADEVELIPGAKLLTFYERSHTISWINSLQQKDDDSYEKSLLETYVSKDINSDIPVITVVHLWGKEQGAELHIRRVYFPSNSSKGIAHSGGAYEQSFLSNIRKRLRRSDEEL